MKKLNKKGFTLIELLAVIVILALLVAVAVPAVTKYLNTARKGTLSSSAATAISAVRNDYLENGYTGDKEYKLNRSEGETATSINDLLEKKLEKSPFNNNAYQNSSKITVTNNGGVVTYHICLVDGNGAGIDKDEVDVTAENVKTSGISCS